MSNKIEMKLTDGFVQRVAVYGSDETFFKVSRVCTGHGFEDKPDDESHLADFIDNLYKRKHMRPFEFAGIVFGIRCPIYVERQLRTYRKPDVERSLRFCEPIEVCQSNKNDLPPVFLEYLDLREKGFKKEDARRVLPLCTLTEVVSYYSIRSLFHVFDERLAPAAQAETREYAEALYTLAKESFRITFDVYDLHR